MRVRGCERYACKRRGGYPCSLPCIQSGPGGKKGEDKYKYVNLGRTPEFTSKIISVVCFHAKQGRLGQALDRIAEIRKPAVASLETSGPPNKKRKSEMGVMKLTYANSVANPILHLQRH